MNPTLLSFHRWLGLLAGALIVVAAVTAVALNHQDVWRKAPANDVTAGPYSQYLLALAADPRDPERLLAGTANGLFRSADGGSKWEKVTLPVPAKQVVSIVFDPARPRLVYVACRGTGIYHSTDGGAAWQEVSLPFKAADGTDVAGLSLAQDGRLIVLTPAGVYSQGATAGSWRQIPRPAAPPRTQTTWVIQAVYDLHDGRFWGRFGAVVTDAVSVAMIGLVASGYLLFFGRGRRFGRWRGRKTRRLGAPR